MEPNTWLGSTTPDTAQRAEAVIGSVTSNGDFRSSLTGRTYEGDLAATAMHEAGHAVLGLRHGIVLHEVSISPTASRTPGAICLGHTSFMRTPNPETEADCALNSNWVQAQLQLTLAGRAAEALLFGYGDPGLQDRDATDDHDMRRMLRIFLTADRIETYYWELFDRLQDKLTEPLSLSRISHLVAALLEHPTGTMSAGEMRHLLTNGRCGAPHPSLAGVTCEFPPHRSHNHQSKEWGPLPHGGEGWNETIWPGFSPERGKTAAPMSAIRRRLNAINRGHPPPRRPQPFATDEERRFDTMLRDGSLLRMSRQEQSSLKHRKLLGMIARTEPRGAG